MVYPEVMMKNWLSIGQFAKRSGLTPRSLRIYEKQKLLISSNRGENKYRYYREDQLEQAKRIKEFKNLGFTLSEISSILQINPSIDTNTLVDFLNRRLFNLNSQETKIKIQKNEIIKIITSLAKSKPGLTQTERNHIMKELEKLTVVITGVQNLKLTAKYLQQHLVTLGLQVKLFTWQETLTFSSEKFQIIVVPESLLLSEQFKGFKSDVIIIKNLSRFNEEIEKCYLKLYSDAGPHKTTILNADDRISVQLACNKEIQKGKMFYFSKNAGLRDQIKKIGGVLSNGEEVQILNQVTNEALPIIKLKRFLGHEEEISYLAALTAIIDIGLNKHQLLSFNV